MVLKTMRKHRKILYPVLYAFLVLVIIFNIVTQSTKSFMEERKKYLEANKKKGKEGMGNANSKGISSYSNYGHSRDDMPTKYVDNRKYFIKKWNFQKAELKGTTLDDDEYKKHCIDHGKKDDYEYEGKNEYGIRNDIGTKVKSNLIDKTIDGDTNLVNYRVLSSYNSCCGGYTDMDYVDVEILRLVLKRGARFVDFEVYSVDGMPVVGSSAYNNPNGTQYFCRMDSLNNVALSDCFEIIKQEIENGLKKPFFINLRIHSKKLKVYHAIAGLINDKLNDNRTENGEGVVQLKASESNNIFILAENPVSDLIEKNKNHKLMKDFYSKVNLLYRKGHSSEQRINKISSTEVGELGCTLLTSGESSDCKIFKKNIFTIVTPPKQVELKNYNPKTAKEKGAQFTAMNWANIDEHMSSYYNEFYNQEKPLIKKSPTTELPSSTIKLADGEDWGRMGKASALSTNFKTI